MHPVLTADEELTRHAQAFLDRTLPKSEWTHKGHLAAASWLIASWGLARCEAEMPDLIRRYNDVTGVPNTDTEGYHHTITLASLRVIDHVRAELPNPHIPAQAGICTPLTLFHAVMNSSYAEKDWLFRHWRRETLFTPEARRDWVAPDVSPLF